MDEYLSKKSFEFAIELCEDDGEIEDVINDITFLSEEWAEDLREEYGIEDTED